LPQFIGFRQDDDHAAPQRLDPLYRHHILRHPHTCLDQQNHSPEGLSLFEILLDHRPPLRPHGFGDLGVTVSGQVDQRQQGELRIRGADRKKIDGACFPRRLADLGQLLPVKQGIDQRGLPDIRSADKRDFRQSVGRKLFWGDRTFDKLSAE